MLTNLRIPRTTVRFSIALAAILLLSVGLFAQSTVSTGNIVGTVTDPSGAILSGTRVVITNTGTGQTIELTSNSAGAYNSGPLTPGTYKVQVSAKGFNTVSTVTTVQVGNTATVNAKMQLGQESTTIEVQASSVGVNTEQAEVQGVLTSTQIENLPINGRNFLDLAQLEPGVQIQDGQDFDPTKAGYSGISFGGRYGRTARIYVDGVDISDETVGTSTQNIPASAIDEFQISQSSLDLSNDLTSSGAINVSTRSGSNSLHGEAFGLFRDITAGGAAGPGGQKLPFQQSQWGGRIGGPVIKDRLFFFLDGERTKQDSVTPLVITGPLSPWSGNFPQPFRETDLLSKVDYTVDKIRFFYRYTYFQNFLAADAGYGYSLYGNKDFTRNQVVGADFNTGKFTHSIRFSYLKFQNKIADATTGSSLPLANLGVTLHIGSFFSGPNLLAPQSTPQSDHQIKYDGSTSIHSHIFRYGVSYNHLQGGGFASFFGLAPYDSTSYNAANQRFARDSCDPNYSPTGPEANPLQPCFPGVGGGLGDSNPLNYPVRTVISGNGLGYNTLQPAFGFPAGGLGPDNRFGAYVGDAWKIKSNFTLSIGVRYDRDTGRTDSDLPAIPEINNLYPTYGNAVKQANMNFAPQIGFAWDPAKNGKTVIRGGAGLYYENIIWNNVLFDRPLRLRTGAFLAYPTACANYVPQPVSTNTGFITPGDGVCAQPGTMNPIAIGVAAPAIAAFQQTFQALNPPDLAAANPNFIGNALAAGVSTPLGLFAPNYKSPRSLQMNIGIQRELHKGMVVSADFLRNIETHSLLGIDVNQVGSVQNFNQPLALSAISDTNNQFGCGTGTDGTSINCAISAGATMADYASWGLTSSNDFGGACATNAVNPTTGNPLGRGCAFGGINPNAGAGLFLKPIGRSVYNALQVKLSQNVTNPFRGVRGANFQVSYSLSRFENSGGAQVNGTPGESDQDFVIQAIDNNQPNRFFGPSLLDRTHQLSFGGYLDVPAGFRIGMIGHFYSPLAGSLIVPNSQIGNGEIFRTDFTGDGSVQDPMPGTHLGNFDRGINASNINAKITNYNNTVAGQPTPAGQTLVTAGLFTASQLATPACNTTGGCGSIPDGYPGFNGVAPQIASAPTGQVNYAWLKSFDLNLKWRYKIKERFTIEPSINVFNVFNFANFDLPSSAMASVLNGPGSGSVNGTTAVENEQFRVGRGTGVYALGAPRQTEFGLRIEF